MRGDNGLLRCARNDVAPTEYVAAISRRHARALQNHSPIEKRAQGMPGACCTRGLVCNECEENAHEHTGTAGALRHSLRNGLTAYTALSLETNSFCLHRRRIEGLSKPGWVDVSSAGLTPATGARTTRLCRTQPRQSSARCVRSQAKARPATTTTRPTLPRPPQPAPTFVTMANAPLPRRDGGICRGDLGLARSSIFLRTGLDRANRVEVAAENRFCAHRKHEARRADWPKGNPPLRLK